MDARSNPVRRRSEAVSSDNPTHQLPDVDMALDKPLDSKVIVDARDIDAASALKREYLDELKFNEEPITIQLSSTQEKNPPKWVPCWNQGIGAEVLMVDGSWVQLGYLPIGVEMITKRKYVEVLLGSKVTRVTTEHDDANVENPRNIVHRVTSANVIVTIIEDKSPQAREWLRRVTARNT
jgi:hypothetical protein